MKSNPRVNTAATLQAVYLVWFFLSITTMCNLFVFGLVCGKFPESFTHVQAVDTRPLFPPITWLGYEARHSFFILGTDTKLSILFQVLGF